YLGGDANHDRSVDFADLVAVAQNYGKIGGQKLVNGDFDGDGNVDFSDLVKVAQAYGTTLAPPTPAEPVAGEAVAPAAAALAPVAMPPLKKTQPQNKRPLPALSLPPKPAAKTATFSKARIRG